MGFFMQQFSVLSKLCLATLHALICCIYTNRGGPSFTTFNTQKNCVYRICL